MRNSKALFVVVGALVVVGLILQVTNKRVLVWERWVSAESQPEPNPEPGKLQRLRSQSATYDCYYFTGRSIKKHGFLDSRSVQLGVGVDECPFIIGPDD